MTAMVDNVTYFETDEDDVRQEMALLKLEGKKPNKALVRAKLNEKQMQVPSYYEAPKDAVPAFQGDPTPSLETIERLMTWAKEQGPKALDLMREFMDNPENWYEVIQKMYDAGLVSKKAMEPPPSTLDSFVELLRRQFRKNGTLDQDQLQELANRELSHSARPANTLYKTLQRMLTDGTITKVSSGVYKWAETN